MPLSESNTGGATATRRSKSKALTLGLAFGLSTSNPPYTRALVASPAWSPHTTATAIATASARARVRPRPQASCSSRVNHQSSLSMALDRRQEQQQHSRRRDSGIVDTEDVRAVLGAERKRCSSSRGSEACDTGAPPLETSVRDYAESLRRVGVSMLAGLMLVAGMSGAGGLAGVAAAAGDGEGVAVASMAEPTSSVTVRDLQGYDGFEDYAAQGQQMENSDVGCFANECKRETASCFTDGSCLKGVTCLGRCKGEQECATRCFAQYGSTKLDSWLTCTLEDHSCVKIPKDMDFSVIDKDPPHIVKGFDPKMLQGTWYKIMGVNKKYDCFDCQKNTFSVARVADGDEAEGGSGQVADIKVNFRLAKPDSADFWENTITERLQVDPVGSPRTFHTDGKLFGLTFKENWYVTGQSNDPGQEFVFVQYKGHTLQGSYDGGFVYARKPYLPSSALAKVAKVAREHGIDPDAMTPIDNTCSMRPSLPRAGDTNNMNVLERVKYEMSFVYDLMEWVHPGTIHKYASTDQRKLQATSSSPKKSDVLASTVTNSVGGPSSSLTAGGPRTLDGLDGNDG